MRRPLDLVSIGDIAGMLGVTRQRADALSRTKDFPEPVATVAGGRLWMRDEVLAWMRDTGRA
jgi:predicted DNA-binding transcriptional regulator AlpA